MEIVDERSITKTSVDDFKVSTVIVGITVETSVDLVVRKLNDCSIAESGVDDSIEETGIDN